MTDLRTAAQQALEALEYAQQDRECPSTTRQAIAALRAALEQQDEPAQQTRKDGRYSVAYRCKCGHEQNVTEIVHGGRTYAGSGANWCDGCGDGPPVRVDAMQQQAEPLKKCHKRRNDPCACSRKAMLCDGFGPPQQAEPAQDIHGACPTHCCPVHGCKYMHDDCPVVSGAVQPVYPRNNGCESCADEAEPLNLSDRAVQRRLASQWGYVPAAQAEAVQEPVYKVKVTSRWHDTEPLAPAFSLPDGEHLLYAAPPQRKPLTEEEIESCRQKGYAHAGFSAPFDFGKAARAVERAHGIKE